MSQKLTASMPDALVIDNDYQVSFTAVDAVTGAVVTAVKVSAASLLVANLSTSPDAELASGPFQLIPLDVQP